MLEALVSSKIRRALLEYVLTHPTEPFYLRGLAKELQLSVSPLRRELKRLEQSGMLSARQEGNMLFYTLNQQSPAYQQMQHEVQQLAPHQAGATVAQAAAVMPPVTIEPAGDPVPAMRQPLSATALLGVSVVGLAMVLTVAGLFYARMTNQHSMGQMIRGLVTDARQPAPAVTSGVMQSGRWRVMPGGVGAFGSGARGDTYR